MGIWLHVSGLIQHLKASLDFSRVLAPALHRGKEI